MPARRMPAPGPVRDSQARTVTVRFDGGPLDGDLLEVESQPGRRLVHPLPPMVVRPTAPVLDEASEQFDWRPVAYTRAPQPPPGPGGAWRFVPL